MVWLLSAVYYHSHFMEAALKTRYKLACLSLRGFSGGSRTIQPLHVLPLSRRERGPPHLPYSVAKPGHNWREDLSLHSSEL